MMTSQITGNVFSTFVLGKIIIKAYKNKMMMSKIYFKIINAFKYFSYLNI